MEDHLSRFLHFRIKSNKKWTLFRISPLIVMIVLLVIAFIFAKYRCPEWDFLFDIYINLVASIIALVFAYYMILAISFLLGRHEDEIKVSYRNSKMLKQYKKDSPYRKVFRLRDDSNKFVVYCDDLIKCDNNTKVEVVDHPERRFELDTFIKLHSFELHEAHSRSLSEHSLTVRMCDFQAPNEKNNRTAVITTERSTYLAHMLTNRVLDYPLKDDISIRYLYENTNVLNDPKHAKMSNHFGINALVFLEPAAGEKKGEKYLLMPKRGPNATVVKNGVTASIAVRLKMDGSEDLKEIFPNGYGDKLTTEFVTHDCIYYCLKNCLLLTDKGTADVKKLLTEKPDRITFLGLARDPYEGGKPTLFFAVTLPMTPEEFHKMQNPDYKAGSIDEVEEILVVDWKAIDIKYKHNKRFADVDDKNIDDKDTDNAKLVLTDILSKRKKPQKLIFEQNLISNFWFYTEYIRTKQLIQ